MMVWKRKCIVTLCMALCFIFQTAAVKAEEQNPEDFTIIELAENAVRKEMTSVLDDDGNNVTDIFARWYGTGQEEKDILNWLDEKECSFLTVLENESDSKQRGFASKTASQVFVDSFAAQLIENEPQTVQYTTTVSGCISYNANTYDVVSIYGESVSTRYTGNYPFFVSFFAEGYSTSTSISSDRTYGYITGSVSLCVTLYPDNPIVSETRRLKRVSHTLSISA